MKGLTSEGIYVNIWFSSVLMRRVGIARRVRREARRRGRSGRATIARNAHCRWHGWEGSTRHERTKTDTVGANTGTDDGGSQRGIAGGYATSKRSFIWRLLRRKTGMII